LCSGLIQVSNAKVVGMPNASGDDVGSKADDVRHVLTEVNAVKGRQESLTTKLDNLKLLVNLHFDYSISKCNSVCF